MPSLILSPPNTLDDAGLTIAKLLGDFKLGVALVRIGKVLEKDAQQEFFANLTAFALLIDEAITAPDYWSEIDRWQFPVSRRDYHERRYRSNIQADSIQRQDIAKFALRHTLEQVVVYPAEAPRILEQSLARSFLVQVGVWPFWAERWSYRIDAVRRAIHTEALLPLRALHEFTHMMEEKYQYCNDSIRKLVNTITRHIVQGNYRQWRYHTPNSQRQMEILSPYQQETWIYNLRTTAKINAEHLLTSHEEDDIELLWATKVGGPSHGFDHGGHCLLPLLANARTKALIIHDTRWPQYAVARAYLRLLQFENGDPVLYLESTMRDFHYAAHYREDHDENSIEWLMFTHSAQKAHNLGIPLSIDMYADELMPRELKVATHISDHRYLMRASAGIFEASDTLTSEHDWVQNFDEYTNPITRLIYTPNTL